MGQGRRGMAFESFISASNRSYERNGVALINKRATPVKVEKSKGSKVLSGYFESKSTVDYDGIYKGKSIVFEAKSTAKESRFDLSMIAGHQLEYMQKAEEHGAIAFFLIEFRTEGAVFVVPNHVIQSYVRMSQQPKGKKSIPRADFDVYGYQVYKSERAVIDYLAYIDERLLIPITPDNAIVEKKLVKSRVIRNKMSRAKRKKENSKVSS